MMSNWIPIVGKHFAIEQFTAYVGALLLGTWRPSFIVLHHTGSPTLAERPFGMTYQHIVNLERYYQNLGWHAGPHCIIDQNGIWVFTPLTVPGVHSPSWNTQSWGVELVGNYETEAFTPRMQAQTIATLVALHSKIGLEPTSLRFHKEDPLTTHHSCPGKHVQKHAIIEALAQVYTAWHLEHPPKAGDPT